MINPLHPLSKGLVGSWLFNEGAGSRVNDISGHGNHGTLKNMSPNAQNSGWGGSKFGGALEFDGVNDHLNFGSFGNFTSENFTLNACIYINAFHTGGPARVPVLFYKGKYVTNGYYMQLDHGAAGNDGGFKLQTNQSGATQITYSDASILSIGQWMNISIVRVGSNVDLYLNGKDVTNTHGTHINPASSSSNFLISRYNNSGYYLDGSIDSVLIYNRALSVEEIATLHHDPFCNMLRVPVRYVPAAAAGLPIPVAMNHYRRRRVA